MKNNKGFTLVEIIVVLVILAILAAATIPSMLGFVNDAKNKSMSAEVRAVYVAAQAYATEQYGMGTITDNTEIANNLKGAIAEGHVLYTMLQGDADGTVVDATVDSGRVSSIVYEKNGKQVTLTNGAGLTYSEQAASPETSPEESTGA